MDVCVYDGKGHRIGDPVCRCTPGHWGTWCEQSGNGARTGETMIDPIRPGDLLSIEGVEPRHSDNNTISSEDHQSKPVTVKQDDQGEVQEVTEKEFHTADDDSLDIRSSSSSSSLSSDDDSLGIRSIHSDVFNSGKLIEHHLGGLSLGTKEEGLEK